jgi:GDPmannose 4,6-dehydratase
MRILVIGAKGQDGSYAYKQLKSLGHNVIGVIRPNEKTHEKNWNERGELHGLIPVDLSDPRTSFQFLDKLLPERIFNFAAVHSSSVKAKNFENESEAEIFKVNYLVNRNLIDWLKSNTTCRLSISLSSQMYHVADGIRYVDENSIINPITVYGKAKAETFKLIKEIRFKSDLFISGSILFNHTSVRSKEDFLFIQLADQILKYSKGETDHLRIKDFEAYVDISHADEIVNGIMSSLEIGSPEDFVFSSGRDFKIRQITIEAMRHLKLPQIESALMLSADGSPRGRLIGVPHKAEALLKWLHPKSPTEILVEIFNKRNELSN